jgi:hypothetical protein
MALYVVGKLGFSSNAYSFSWWLVADVDLFWEKKIYWLVVGLFWEKSVVRWWLISQTNTSETWDGSHNHHRSVRVNRNCVGVLLLKRKATCKKRMYTHLIIWSSRLRATSLLSSSWCVHSITCVLLFFLSGKIR